jgi:branched-subunit amino acid ABC-type transport system permease component
LGVALSNQAILSVSVAFLTVILLIFFLRKTRIGRGIRAVSQDRDIAAISGIHAEKIYLITVTITGVLAGIAGVLVAPIQTLTPKIGWEMMLTAFTVTILGIGWADLGNRGGGWYCIVCSAANGISCLSYA